MTEYIITDKQMGLIQDFATVCVEGEKLPKIVRCRDCKRFHTNTNGLDCPKLDPDGFCAWAERKEP